MKKVLFLIVLLSIIGATYTVYHQHKHKTVSENSIIQSNKTNSFDFNKRYDDFKFIDNNNKDKKFEALDGTILVASELVSMRETCIYGKPVKISELSEIDREYVKYNRLEDITSLLSGRDELKHDLTLITVTFLVMDSEELENLFVNIYAHYYNGKDFYKNFNVNPTCEYTKKQYNEFVQQAKERKAREEFYATPEGQKFLAQQQLQQQQMNLQQQQMQQQMQIHQDQQLQQSLQSMYQQEYQSSPLSEQQVVTIVEDREEYEPQYHTYPAGSPCDRLKTSFIPSFSSISNNNATVRACRQQDQQIAQQKFQEKQLELLQKKRTATTQCYTDYTGQRICDTEYQISDY